MNNFVLREKRKKADEYAAQPVRFQLEEITLRMRSSHGIRRIKYSDSKWSCTCQFFQDTMTCSHIMAAQKLFSTFLGHRPDFE
jgi:hypothetical protein